MDAVARQTHTDPPATADKLARQWAIRSAQLIPEVLALLLVALGEVWPALILAALGWVGLAVDRSRPRWVTLAVVGATVAVLVASAVMGLPTGGGEGSA